MCSLSSETKFEFSLFQIWSTHSTLIDLLLHVLQSEVREGGSGQ